MCPRSISLIYLLDHLLFGAIISHTFFLLYSLDFPFLFLLSFFPSLRVSARRCTWNSQMLSCWTYSVLGEEENAMSHKWISCVPWLWSWLWFWLVHVCAMTHSFDESLIVTLILTYSFVPWLWFRLIHMCAMTLTVTLIFEDWNKAETKRQNGLQKRVCLVSVCEMRLKSCTHAHAHTHTHTHLFQKDRRPQRVFL